MSASVTELSLSVPLTELTVLFHAKRSLGLARARSAMIRLARSSSRRWMIVTVSANLVRNRASSMAESPPPTTAMSWPRKKNPSQVAHQETPWPDSRFSSGRPSSRYPDPIARITAWARCSAPSPSTTTLISPSRDMAVTSSVTSSAPKRSAWARRLSMRSGPMIPCGNPGKFSTSVVFIRAPPAVTAPSNTSGRNAARAA